VKHFLIYALIRIITFPFAFLPYSWIHATGILLGTIGYYLVPKYRKRALSNLSLATDLALSKKELIRLARASCQNLMITALEYSKFAKEKNISKIATCVNPEEASRIMKEGKGIIFFCAHQANWETLFLEGTSRMPGVAIGRPIRNKYLYNWILSIREKFGGKIIPRKNAAKEGLRALKNGSFFGIVGDQGMPDSGFQSLFLGRKAWTSPLPAILSYRTGCPIIVATTKRKKCKYYIHYSHPIWPNLHRLMTETLSLLEKSIKEEPGQWMWQHNRWKQQTPNLVRPPYRQESICIIMPQEKLLFDLIVEHLPTLRKIYPHEFFTFIVPEEFKEAEALKKEEVILYQTLEDILISDYRFKLVFNFHGDPIIRSHFLSLSAFDVVTLKDLENAVGPTSNLSELFKQALLYAK
jgi:Kdo2-lipid IVA lauroyltransferase/acyltransferase